MCVQASWVSLRLTVSVFGSSQYSQEGLTCSQSAPIEPQFTANHILLNVFVCYNPSLFCKIFQLRLHSISLYTIYLTLTGIVSCQVIAYLNCKSGNSLRKVRVDKSTRPETVLSNKLWIQSQFSPESIPLQKPREMFIACQLAINKISTKGLW